MSTSDFSKILDEPRPGVASYADLERMLRQKQYSQALTALQKNPSIARNIPYPVLDSLYAGILSTVGEEKANLVLELVRKVNKLERTVNSGEIHLNGSIPGSDVY